MEAILSHIRLFKWNVKSLQDYDFPQAQVLFLIKSRLFSNVRFSYPISFSFPFNPKRLSSATTVQTMAYQAVWSTQQFKDEKNVVGLAHTISGYLVKNHSFGLDTFSNPNSPRVLIVVEINKTDWVLKGFPDCVARGEIDGVPFDEEKILMTLRNLHRVPLFSDLEPIDESEPLGLTQVPGLDLFKPYDVGELMAAGDDQGTCSICFEEFSMDSCRKMPCSHVFHGHCIAKWLWRKRSCPMCRSQLVN